MAEANSEQCANAPVNQDGQTMGAKGRKTRRRLIEAATRLLNRTPLRDLRVADIAREAETSPATFYKYFNDVADAVLAAAGELSPSTPAIIEMIDAEWTREDGEARARRIVEDYVAYWGDHAALFRARNLAADEGDQRFRVARERAARPTLVALAARIAQTRGSGGLPDDVSDLALAGALMAMLERVAAVAPSQANSEITTRALTDAASHVFATVLAPPSPRQASVA